MLLSLKSLPLLQKMKPLGQRNLLQLQKNLQQLRSYLPLKLNLKLLEQNYLQQSLKNLLPLQMKKLLGLKSLLR